MDKITFTSKLTWEVVSDLNYSSLVLLSSYVILAVQCGDDSKCGSGHFNDLRDSIGESRLHIEVALNRVHGYVLVSFPVQRSRE